MARRFAVLALLVALAVSLAMSLRKGNPGTAAPGHRASSASRSSFLAMMFTPPSGRTTSACSPAWPDRWALAAVAVTARVMVHDATAGVRRPGAVRHGAVVRHGQRLVVRPNFGVPWSNRFPSGTRRVHHDPAGLSVVTLLWQPGSTFRPRRRPAAGPTRWWSAIGSRWRLAVGDGVLRGAVTDAGMIVVPGVVGGPVQPRALTGKTCGWPTT